MVQHANAKHTSKVLFIILNVHERFERFWRQGYQLQNGCSGTVVLGGRNRKQIGLKEDITSSYQPTREYETL